MRPSAGYLEALWKARLSVLASNLAAGETEHQQLASLARHISADYHGRFLIELLQNASDQAEQGRRADSAVFIVRSVDSIAVTNEGAPFTSEGISSITALGLSSKDPEFSIGNKGVGFKAVFEVTSAPEVYSADEIGEPFETGSCWFRLDERPWDDAAFSAKLSVIAEGLLQEDRGLVQKLDARAGGRGALSFLMDGVRHSAPFRFPVPIDRERLRARLRSLKLPDESKQAQTLIVLPLRNNVRTRDLVETALDQLIEDEGSTLLFLPHVSELCVVDQVRGVHHRVRRGPRTRQRTLERGSVAFDISVETTTSNNKGTTGSRETWRLVQRTMGADPARSDERAAIQAAVADVPGINWSQVETSTVSVGIPVGGGTESTFGVKPGRFCIGLPTLQPTGTSLWVDGRFHGNIARTRIVASLEYNSLLFDEAVRLSSELVEDLKASTNIRRRRLATFAVAPTEESASGAQEDRLLADVFQAEPDGLAWQPIVLSFDGATFLRCQELAIPAAEDAAIFRFVREAVDDIGPYGIVLPDHVLLDNARAVLDRFPGSGTASGVSVDTYLTRPDGLDSLIERTAAGHRDGGTKFWQSFIGWLIKRFRVDDLDDQKVLPIASGELARPSERVFLWPVRRTKIDENEKEVLPEPDEDVVLADEIRNIPEDVISSLRFLDERAIPARVASGVTLTEIARQLAPERGGLVRRPRIVDLLNEAVAPALVAATATPNGERVAISLLALAVRWLRKMSDDARNQVQLANLRVPVTTVDSDEVGWRPPGEVRFHASWSRGATADLLARLTDAQVGYTLLPWERFSELAGRERALEDWRDDFEIIGLWSGPRLITGRRLGRAPFRAGRDNAFQVVGAACPIETAKPFWTAYLNSFAGRYAYVSSGQPYELEEVTWLEGLEREELRAAVFELILRNPRRYRGHANTHTRRQDGHGEARVARSLWADAIRRNDWAVVPTERHGHCSPSITFELESDQRRVDRFKLLPTVPPELASSDILSAVGVTSVGDATRKRLVAALHRLASLLPLPPQQEQTATALAQELYDRLRETLRSDDEAEGISRLTRSPVPLLQTRTLVAADLSDVPIVYIVDDPVRLRLLGREQPFTLPLSTSEDNAPLVRVLRDLLGEERIKYTSEAVVDCGFVATSTDEHLLAALVEAFPLRPIEVDLALLVAYVGKEWWGAADERFLTAWERIGKAKLARGRFADWFEHRSLVEIDEFGNPRLLVAEQLSMTEVLEATHAVVGASHRDAFAVYVRAVADQNPSAVDLFFSERDVGAAERDEIVALVGSAGNMWIVPLRPIVFALWRKAAGGAPLSVFEDVWRAVLSGSSMMEELVGSPVVAEALHSASKDDVEERVAALLDASSISSGDLRSAFDEIGQSWKFSSTERIYDTVAHELASIAMAAWARSAKADAVAANALIEALHSNRPDFLTLEPPRRASVVQLALAALEVSLEQAQSKFPAQAMLARLRAADASNVDLVKESGLARRDVDEYRTRPQSAREGAAMELLEGVLFVASALAQRKGEHIDPDAVKTEARVVVRSSGYLANRFILLASLKEVLDEIAPKTSETLATQRAFHDPRPAQELWHALSSVLGPMTPPTPPPPRTVTLIDISLPATDVDNDLKKGAAGLLGQALAKACASTLDLAALRKNAHQPPPPPSRPVTSDRRRTGGRSHGDALAQQRLVGALGEAFVFEQFKLLLPNFDQTNWVSENRVAYGLPLDNASDAFGADFDYCDSSGVLTGRTDAPQCYLEVKSSTGDSDGPFFMTLSEWERALECHRSGGSKVYLIVRVANADTCPTIVDILDDPIALERTGHVRLAGTEFCVSVGKRR